MKKMDKIWYSNWLGVRAIIHVGEWVKEGYSYLYTCRFEGQSMLVSGQFTVIDCCEDHNQWASRKMILLFTVLRAITGEWLSRNSYWLDVRALTG